MYLTRSRAAGGRPRWALDGRYLPFSFGLDLLLELPTESLTGVLEGMALGEEAGGDPLMAPLEPSHEVWASGVTYEQSRQAREAESEAAADAYARVYESERPELFFKAQGWRVVGHGEDVRVRRDARWSVPEPELVLVLNCRMEIVGYTAGDDVSSRDIEGENPLYLPQAKVYDGACTLGPGIVLVDGHGAVHDLPVGLYVRRGGESIFEGRTSTSRMRRRAEELASYLGRELSFPHGAFLMTGTGIVPPDDFSLEPGDEVQVTVGELVLKNRVAR